MSFRSIKQFQHERDTWKRILNYLRHENVFLKNRLAEILSNTSNEEFVRKAEIFQSSFLGADEYFNLLRGEIAEFDHLLFYETFTDEKAIDIELKYRNIRYLVGTLEKKFMHCRCEFNNYLFENFRYYND